MFRSLKSIQRDVDLGALVDLDHEFNEERRLCQLAEVHTQLTHLHALLERKVYHYARYPENPGDPAYGYVGLILPESLLPICIHSVQE